MTRPSLLRWLSATTLALAWVGLAASVPGYAASVPGYAASASALRSTSAVVTASPGATDPDEGNPALINPTALGSISIHKVLGAALDPAVFPADGTAAALPSTTAPLAGAVFTVTPVGAVDLTTNAGWVQAASLVDNIAAAYPLLGAPITAPPTGADGRAVVSGLPVGLYLVRELGVRSASGAWDPSFSRAADFLVTIPLTDPTSRSGWLYDVHVYPKNSRSGIVKSVADGTAGSPGEDAAVAGQILTYTLTTDIPADGVRAFGGHCLRDGALDSAAGLDADGFTVRGVCRDGATYVGVAAGAAYEIRDDLAAMEVPGLEPVRHTSDFVEFAAPDWSGSVSVALTAPAGTVLLACPTGTDSAAAPACDYVLAQSATAIRVAMTDRGLAALAAAKADSSSVEVEVRAQARVREAVVAATQSPTAGFQPLAPVLRLPNRGELVPHGTRPSQGGGGSPAPVVSNPVVTLYTSLRLHKIDATTQAGLAGAVFTLYRTREDALAGRNPLAVSDATSAAGLTEFAGLHVTDYQNDASDDDSYWIVETSTPQGYVVVAAPIEVKVRQDGTTVGADASHGRPVANTPGSSGPLPNTGANSLALEAIAVALVGAGLLLLLASRRAGRDRHSAAGESVGSGRGREEAETGRDDD